MSEPERRGQIIMSYQELADRLGIRDDLVVRDVVVTRNPYYVHLVVEGPAAPECVNGAEAEVMRMGWRE